MSKEELIQFWQEKQLDQKLVAAFNQVPRERFVPKTLQEHAYKDQPLPTVRNQSISQPTTVMIMLAALELEEGHSVFELGSGGGYQAALLSNIVGVQGKVVSVEVIPELVQIARQNLSDRGNVTIEEADGSDGYVPNAPYDRAIITAACPAIPQPVIDQLKEGGIVVAPVGDIQSQTMVKGTKSGNRLDLEVLGPFRFVPMRGKLGFKES